MSLDAINAIRGAEGSADQTRAEAQAEAQAIVAAAERAGRDLLARGHSQSAAQAAEVMARAEAEAKTRADAILAQARAEAEALEAKAGDNMARAVQAITERVVEQ